MVGHIISPMIFYLAYLSEILNDIFIAIAIVSLVALVSIYTEYRVAKDNAIERHYDENVIAVYDRAKKSVHRVVIIFFIALLGVAIFPPKDVIYKMAAAYYVDNNKLEINIKTIDNIVDKMIKELR